MGPGDDDRRGATESRRSAARRSDVELRSPGVPDPVFVTTPEELAVRGRGWLSKPALALDTEFVRTRTYYARLGLVQVADGRDCYLIDTVALEDLSPLREILARPTIVKVLHSSAEDLEVFHQRFGLFPHPLFDTQLASSLAGYGGSLSYQRMVQELFGVEVPKGETRSNWLRRPLSTAQVEYAVLDVAYLLSSYERLSRELDELGRTAWLEEEVERLVETTRARTDPQYSFSRLRSSNRLRPRELAVLRSLCTWREEEARGRDVPRGFVVTDEVLLHLARRQPMSPEQLSQVKGMKHRERRRSGEEILRRIAEARILPLTELPPAGPRHRPAAGRNRGRVDALRAVVAEAAAELELPAEVLAPRRVLEELVRNVRAGAREPLPEELRGWRYGVIGRTLLEVAQGREG